MASEAIRLTALEPQPTDNEPPFQMGDAVVYAAHGVGRIDQIGIQEIAGHAIQIIQVSFPDNRMILRIPAAKARASGLRQIATREFVEKALTIVAGRSRAGKGLWARRAVEIQNKISSGALVQVAEVVRDLRRHVSPDQGSFSERKLFEAALERLVAEVAVLEGTDKVVVLERLTQVMKDAEAASSSSAAAAAAANPPA